MKRLFYFANFALLFIPFLLIIRTDFPAIPKLNEKVYLCKSQNIFGWQVIKLQDGVILSCKDYISIDTLFKAQSLTVKFNTNQKLKMRVSFRDKGSELISTNTLEIKPKNDNSASTLFFLLDDPNAPKINRLTSDTNEMVLYITNITNLEGLAFHIDEIFLN